MNAVKTILLLATCLVLGLAGLALCAFVSVAVVSLLWEFAAYAGQMALILAVIGFWVWLGGLANA
jgi:hypothetical protein